MAAKAPTRVQYVESPSWNTSGSPRTSAPITWQGGDIIVVIAACEGQNTLGTPTGTGLSFTVLQSNTAASSCATILAVATPSVGGSSAISTTLANGAQVSGMAVWVWRGSNGVGTSTEQHTTTKTKAMVPQGKHSAYCWAGFDFSAAAADAVFSPAQTNIDERTDQGTTYTTYVADLIDQYSSGSTNFGISGGTTVGVISIVAVEILGLDAVMNNYQFLKVGNGMSAGEKIR